MADEVSRARALVRGLSKAELEFLRHLFAGESQATLASRLELGEAEAHALKQALMAKLDAQVTADLVRFWIYANEPPPH